MSEWVSEKCSLGRVVGITTAVLCGGCSFVYAQIGCEEAVIFVRDCAVRGRG